MARRSRTSAHVVRLVALIALVGAGCGQVAVPVSPDGATDTSTSMVTTTLASTTTVSPTTTVPTPVTTTTSTAPITSTTTSTLLPGADFVALVSVTDGDTIDVRFSDGSVDTVRLIGVNTPERGECFAEEATDALISLLPDDIFMTSDVSDRDQYGRLLRYLWDDDGLMINEKLVAGGFALAREYPPDTTHSAILSAAQESATESGLGFWAPDACGVADVGVQTVGHIEYDAPGNDHDNLNGEWVELVNAGSGSVDLTGWALKDESSSHRYRFPSGFTLSAGSSVDVYTGCGTDSSTALYWCNNSAVWNNGGDTAFVVDSAGNIVDSKSY